MHIWVQRNLKGASVEHTGSYNPILRPPYRHWRCKPGIIPFQRADKPSSFAIVAIEPNKPLYLETPTDSPKGALFCS